MEEETKSKTSSSQLESIRYKRGEYFLILDQLKVPHESVYRSIKTVEDGVDAIKTMQVRGAPLIAIVGLLSIAVELWGKEFDSWKDLFDYLEEKVDALIAARPTAVNMKKEGYGLLDFVMNQSCLPSQKDYTPAVKEKVLDAIEATYQLDLCINKEMGKFGAEVILQNHRKDPSEKINVLTHCNTGSLATSGYGTALGVIRALHEMNALGMVYFTETRPYNQGSRLTAFELLVDKIPSTMVCDSAVSWLMKTKNISAVVTGADRVTRNGDTANKIGTYQLALAAKAHNVGFYIAAPTTTIDSNIPSGDKIVIEERPGSEMTSINGQPISPEGIQAWNPAFDVTPAELITGIITEYGSVTPAGMIEQLEKAGKTFKEEEAAARKKDRAT